MTGQRDTRPISWCRIFAVGPPCAHLCEDCTRTAVAQRKAATETPTTQGQSTGD